MTGEHVRMADVHKAIDALLLDSKYEALELLQGVRADYINEHDDVDLPVFPRTPKDPPVPEAWKHRTPLWCTVLTMFAWMACGIVFGLVLEAECNYYGDLTRWDAGRKVRAAGGAVADMYLDVEASAYCPCAKCCGKWADGKTSTGADASRPGVAVDPKLIPLGSAISIPGIGWRTADDVGGTIKGHRIDVRFPTHEEAVKFGRKRVGIRVWRAGE